jgi:4-amino-4-deoxy-L-arabinose transferase-like glycosyltransferase
MEATQQINKTSRYYFPILLVSAIVFFIPFLGSVHLFDWDEINFAESAREMIVTGNYHQVQIDFQPFIEKPPFFFWLQVLSMKAFGINEFAARLPNAIFGIITLCTFYLIGKRHKSELFGFLWALCYLGSFLPHMYFKSGIIDPVFNYFILLGIYFMFRSFSSTNDQRPSAIVLIALSGTFIGLANLTKGPVGLLIFLLTFLVYFIFTRFKNFPSFKKILIFTACFTVVSFFWFGQEVINNGFGFIKGFLQVQADLFSKPVAEHGEPFYYHFVVVFIGCFPISILALPILFSRSSKSQISNHQITKSPNHQILLMKILFWVVILLFSITTTKIIHYSSMTWFPLSFLAAVYLYNLITEEKRISRPLIWLLCIMGFLFSTALTLLPFIAFHKEWLIPYLKDPFAVACFQLPVQWGGWEFIIGILYLAAIIVAITLLAKGKTFKGAITMFYSTAGILFFYLISVVPKIESYSQAPAINFYKSLAGKDVYITTFGFKSYAQFFYFQKQPTVVHPDELDYLVHGPIDKPAYFVTKVTTTDLPQVCPDCKLIKQEGGFMFYRRDPGKQ